MGTADVRRWFDTHRSSEILCPTAVAAILAATVGVAGIRGADYPAHVLRALLWEDTGASVWNFHWYAGHPTPQYSVVAPPVVALIGPFGGAALASVAATLLFAAVAGALLARDAARWASHAFGVTIVVNVVVGRVAFAIGLAIALATLLAWQRGSMLVAIALAVATPLASPVAAVLVLVAATAVAVDARWAAPPRRHRVRRAVAILGAAALPMAVSTSLFHEPAQFPFRAGGVVASVGALVAVVALVPIRPVRIGAILAIAAAIAVFLVPNPLGGSFSRFAQVAAVPLAFTTVPSLRRPARVPVAGLLLVMLVWSVLPGVGAAVAAHGDDSAAADFYTPLLEEVTRRNADGRSVGRLEIPFTDNHWESAFVATAVPYVRGWERQIDLARNPELYDAGLTLDGYHAWLRHNAVRWIAVPDAPLDEGGIVEARLVARADGPVGIPWLRRVWSDPHWRLYEVLDHVPIVDLPAVLVSQGADTVRVQAARPAVVVVRYRYSDHLTISAGGCVAAHPDGWIVARLDRAGTFDLGVDPAASWREGGAERCAAIPWGG